MFEGKNVLVIGGLGFIGSSLAHTLVKQRANVTIFDNLMEDTGANLKNIEGIEDKIKVVIGDIRNAGEITEAVKNKHIIFNCAGQVSHVLSMENPFLDIEINCKGRINVLEACRKENPSAKIIFIGTRTQVGSVSSRMMNEDSQQNPTDVYGAGNLAAEMYHLIYNKVYGMKTVSVRLTNIYGERAQITNPKYGAINWMIGKAVAGEDLTVFEPGTQLRDINYIDDIVDALLQIAQDERTNGEVFMIGSGKGVPFVEIANQISKAVAGKSQVKLVPWPKERKNIEAGDTVIDYSKIKNLLGWEPKTSLEEGLKKTAGYYKENYEEYTKKKKLKVLVTGGLGHIGSKLIREYAKRDDVELIRVIDNFLVQRYCSLFNLPESAKYEFIEGDIMNDYLLNEALKGIDIVIHLAAITDAPSTISNKEETMRINYEGTKKVAEAAAKARVKKFLFASTTSVYGEAEGIVDENHNNYKPSSPYAEAKLKAEKFIQEAPKTLKLNANVVRMGTIFGTSIGMRFHTAVNKFCYLAALGKPLTVWDSALNSMRPYLGLDDAIRAFMFLEKKGIPGEVYNVLTKNYSMSEILDAIKQSADVKIEITKSPLLNQKPYNVSDAKLRALGFEPKDTLEGKVRETLQLFKGIKKLKTNKIFTSKPHVDEAIKEAVNEVFNSGIFSNGEKVKEFERKFAEFHKAKHAIALTNGTVAIEIVLKCLGIKAGDEIIVPSFTTMPTIEPILNLGAIPIFADIDKKNFTIAPENISLLVTPKTKAIMPVHLYGNPADIEKIKEIAESHNLHLIEDCCQAHNAKVNGKQVGTFGIAGCFSFYPTKNLSVLGEGGMILTNDDALAQKAKMLISHGERGRYNHEIVGTNYRLSEIHCAIGIKQLEMLESFTKRRKEIAKLYNKLLKDNEEIILPTKLENAEHVYHLYVIRVPIDKRDKIIEALKSSNIFCGVHYPVPCHMQKAVTDKFGCNVDLPVTEQLATEIISLPIYPDLSDDEVKLVCEKLKENL